MPAPLDYDQALAALTAAADAQPTTRAKREHEAFVAYLMIQGTMTVSDHELATAAASIRVHGWTPTAYRTDEGRVAWHLVDADGNQVKPESTEGTRGWADPIMDPDQDPAR